MIGDRRGGGTASADPDTGEWTAGCFYGCSSSVIATVSFGDESVDVPLPCEEGDAPEPPEPPDGEDANGPLTITDARSFDCQSGAPGSGCQFEASGTGADSAGSASVTVSGFVTGGGPLTVTDPETGAWEATGVFGCNGQPTLTVSAGSDTDDTLLTCG